MKKLMHLHSCVYAFALVAALLAELSPHIVAQNAAEYRRRVNSVRTTKGFVALWDFVKRKDGRFDAYQAQGDRHDFSLDAMNYVQTYWNAGRAAGYEDFPLLNRGPFGQAVRIRRETDKNFRPVLLVPRERLHNSGLDVKGPGHSVSMVAWVIRESGNHALAGIWHEGTDLEKDHSAAQRVEHGKRQYALFAGLAGNNGGVAAHVSENGAASFGDKYARNMAVTPEKMEAVSAASTSETLDHSWHVAAFSFDAKRHTVTAYLDGKASEMWIENPEQHPFYKWAAKGWKQAQLHKTPGLQPEEDPAFPAGQFYEPPENRPLSRTVVRANATERVEIQQFPFTRVRVTLQKDSGGKMRIAQRELIALRANPFWFNHGLYFPATPEEGGPFTIGRVIHTGKTVGFTGYIGGVAVFNRALGGTEMKRLASFGQKPIALSEADPQAQPHATPLPQQQK